VIGTYDVYQIATKGQRLYERKRMLESLASLHGYSPTGWNRYSEYQEFMQEYGDIVKMYQDYKANPWISSLSHVGLTVVIIPAMISRAIKESKAEKKKED
jgi:hypothetical protein